MRKKVIALIASVAMVVTMIPSAAFAAEETKGVPCDGGPDCTHEAEMNGLHYDTLEEAVGVQYADIKLLKDVELDESLEITKEISLDLSGKTISSGKNGVKGRSLIEICNNAKAHISNGNLIGRNVCILSGKGSTIWINGVNFLQAADALLANDSNVYLAGTVKINTGEAYGPITGDGNLFIVEEAEITVDGRIAGSEKITWRGQITNAGTINCDVNLGIEGSELINEKTGIVNGDIVRNTFGAVKVTNAGTLNGNIRFSDDNSKVVNKSTGIINGEILGGKVENELGGVINSNHSWEWVVLIEPTSTMIGLKYRSCNVCGEKEYAFIPATGSATMPGGNTGGSSGNSSGSGTASGNGSTGKLEAVPGTDNAVRVSGDTRFETATNVADQLKEIYGVEKFENIVITYSDIFADAMSATALATDKEAPILVVNENNEGYVKKYVSENLAKNGNVYIIGGTGVVSERFENSLENYKVKRISGKDRYETNLAVLKELNLSGTEEIMIASGSGFADALSASATGNAIMLVGDKLTVEQEAFIKRLNAKNEYFVVGGTGAVNNAVYNQVKTVGSGDVTRISGSTRYDTSAAIAEEFFGKAKSVFVASGDDFPDGLTGGVLANATGAPLLLANENNTSQAENFVVGNKARMVTAIGGSRALSDKAIGKIA